MQPRPLTYTPHDKEATSDSDEICLVRDNRLDVGCRELHVGRPMLASGNARLDQEVGHDQAS
jgi:hypothetical protein